jgi:hypothetical protein
MELLLYPTHRTTPGYAKATLQLIVYFFHHVVAIHDPEF